MFIVDINLFWICYLGDYILYIVLVSVIVMMLEFCFFGSQKSEIGFFLYGVYEEWSEFKGIMDFCDFCDVDEDKDDDDFEIMQ